MKITTDLLILIHDRIKEACLAKHDINFDTFNIWDDGTITCYYTPNYHYADEENYDITVEDLQLENLDNLITERKEREKREREKRIEESRILKERGIENDKRLRREQYLNLKKEFGNE